MHAREAHVCMCVCVPACLHCLGLWFLLLLASLSLSPLPPFVCCSGRWKLLACSWPTTAVVSRGGLGWDEGIDRLLLPIFVEVRDASWAFFSNVFVKIDFTFKIFGPFY